VQAASQEAPIVGTCCFEWQNRHHGRRWLIREIRFNLRFPFGNRFGRPENLFRHRVSIPGKPRQGQHEHHYDGAV
jgi:hypothetical protein